MPALASRPVKAALVNWLPWSVLKISGLPKRAREQNRFFEGVMVDDLVERDDEFLEMLLLVLVSRVNRSPSLGADNTVLEATNQRENAEMFFVEHLSQFCQKRHRRTTALHAMQYEFAALQQCNRSPIAT